MFNLCQAGLCVLYSILSCHRSNSMVPRPSVSPPPFPLHFLNNLKVGHGGSLMYTHTPLFPSKPEQKCHTGGSVGEIKEGEHTAADCFISFTPGRRGSAWLGEGCWGGGWHWRCCCFSPTVSIIHLREVDTISGQTEP